MQVRREKLGRGIRGVSQLGQSAAVVGAYLPPGEREGF